MNTFQITFLKTLKIIFKAWVQFGVPIEESEQLIERLLAATQDEELADVAFESLSSMVTHPETHKYPNHLMNLLKRLVSI